jgi:hypothetical protein
VAIQILRDVSAFDDVEVGRVRRHNRPTGQRDDYRRLPTMIAMTAPIALVTCAEIPELEDDDQLVIGPLAALGFAAEPVVWDDPAVDWNRYCLAVLRSPWDYASRQAEFVAWAARTPRLANPAAVVAWNTDKRYLAELDAAGVAMVPTDWLEPGDEWAPPDVGHWVIKPSISAGSRDTGRYDLAVASDREHATAHVRRLLAAGRTVMIQPYLEAVDTCGETALMFVGGEFSHAIRKGPMLDGPDLGPAHREPGLYKPEAISARDSSAAERALAEHVLTAMPSRLSPLLYARVDLIPGPGGAPILIELELTEPSLFLGFADGAAQRFAEAIAAAAKTA